MELALEGILETLLVGAVASLCLLSPLFLLVGHLVHFGPLQHLFVYLLYEESAVVELEEPRPVGESARVFGILVMVASLFGLGVLTETFSNLPGLDFKARVTGVTDEEIRLASLETNALSALRGGALRADFAAFMSDYLACRELAAAAGGAYRAYPSPCTEQYARAKTFYYTAKNTVYRDAVRYEELIRHQSRIDFARAVASALALLSAIWFVGSGVAFLAELRRGPILAADRGWWDRLLRHWLRLSGLRCLGSSVCFGALSMAVVTTWGRLEAYYDLRVFGYYVADGPPARGGPDGAAASGAFVRDVPESAWLRFRGPTPGQPFEPSAVARLGDEPAVLVVDDKDPVRPFSVFALDHEHRLAAEGQPLVFPTAPEGRFGKLESVHVEVVDGVTTVYAAGTFDADYAGSARLFRFSLMGSGEGLGVIPKSVQVFDDLPDPCAVLPGAADGCFVEGLTRDGPDLLLGVRFLGRGTKRAPTFALVRLRATGGSWTPELELATTLPAPFTEFGISGLERSSTGELLVLTSREVPAAPGRTATSTVSGALWRLTPGIDGRFRTTPTPGSVVSVFPHKPEGLTDLGDGRVLVVFDDDTDRKGRHSLPDTFALGMDESVYTVVGLDPPPAD